MAAEHLRPAARTLLLACAEFARACGRAMTGPAPLDRAPLISARNAFEAAVDSARRERLTRDLTFDAVSPYFGLIFAADSLYGHLGDLADRIEERTGGGRALSADPTRRA